MWETHHSCLKAEYIASCKIATWVLCVEAKITQARILPGLTWHTSVEDKEFLLSDVR